MDENDIKKMVRSSIERIIREESTSLRSAPEDIHHFQKIFLKAALAAKVHIDLGESPRAYEIIYESWEDVKSELSLVSSPDEMLKIWKDISGHYLYETALRIFSEHPSFHKKSQILAERVKDAFKKTL